MKKFLMQLVSPNLPDDIGGVHIQWEFPEFVQAAKSRLWYIVVSIIVALLIVYAIMTANFLFAMILALVAFIIIYQYFQSPRQIPVVIAEDGIIVDKQFYPYKALKSFAIIYEPPVIKFLYLDFKSQFKKSLPVPLEDVNPLKVREALLSYLDENLEIDEEDSNETFSRLMNIR